MSKPSEHLDVYLHKPDSERQYEHWRVWDTRVGYNIVMGAKTKEEALLEAIDYWAARAVMYQKDYEVLHDKVSTFVKSVDVCDCDD